MAKKEELPALNEQLLLPILTEHFGHAVNAVSAWEMTALNRGSGLASGGPIFISGQAQVDGTLAEWAVVLKVVQPPVGSRYAQEAQLESHWAYWRREPLAYSSGLLTGIRGLRAPRCLSVVEQADSEAVWLWLEAVQEAAEPQTAAALRHVARALGQFNGTGPSDSSGRQSGWLARHALRSRIERLERDASPVGFARHETWSDPRVRQGLGDGIEPALVFLWRNRSKLLNRLDAIPQTIVHGDTNPGNLLLSQPSLVDEMPVALDWSNLGIAALGSDLADLFVWTTLSHRDASSSFTMATAVSEYSAGLSDVGYNFANQDVIVGFSASAALMLAARLYWFITHALQAGANEPALAQWQPAVAIVSELADEVASQFHANRY